MKRCRLEAPGRASGRLPPRYCEFEPQDRPQQQTTLSSLFCFGLKCAWQHHLWVPSAPLLHVAVSVHLQAVAARTALPLAGTPLEVKLAARRLRRPPGVRTGGFPSAHTGPRQRMKALMCLILARGRAQA